MSRRLSASISSFSHNRFADFRYKVTTCVLRCLYFPKHTEQQIGRRVAFRKLHFIILLHQAQRIVFESAIPRLPGKHSIKRLREHKRFFAPAGRNILTRQRHDLASQPGFTALLKPGEAVFQGIPAIVCQFLVLNRVFINICLLYTSDAADD